jgi:hypothetical protein
LEDVERKDSLPEIPREKLVDQKLQKSTVVAESYCWFCLKPLNEDSGCRHVEQCMEVHMTDYGLLKFELSIKALINQVKSFSMTLSGGIEEESFDPESPFLEGADVFDIMESSSLLQLISSMVSHSEV